MLLHSHVTARQLVLPKKKAITLKFIAQSSRFHPLCEKLIAAVLLSQNKLLHWIWQLLHFRPKDSVRKMKGAELHPNLFSLSVSLRCNVS